MEQTQAGDYRWPGDPSEPPPPPTMSAPELPTPRHVAARGFAQTFGLHPAIALTTIAVDTMLFPSVGISLGALWPVALAAGVVLGYITFTAQQKWYGDDKESAKIKALILAFLTAIPTPLPYALFIPAGIVGLFRRKTDN
jgi:hypothetical protein